MRRSQTNPTLLAGLAALAAAALLLSGCDEVEPRVETDTAAQAIEAPADIVHEVRVRIALSISTTDPLLPGEDVVLTVRGVAEERIDSGEVVLTLPTRALMDHDGTAALPELPAVARWELPPMEVGDVWSGRHTVPGEAKGYYRVLANAYTHGPDGGFWLFDDVFRSAWLYIHETDGRMTRFFEESVFPEGVHPVAGPAAGWPTAATSENDTTTELHRDSVYLHVVYTTGGDFKPAEGALMWGTLKLEDRGWEDLGTKRVPDSGIVAFKCAKHYGGYVMGGGSAPETSRVQGRLEIASWSARGCGTIREVRVKPHRYYPWRVLNIAANRITDHFGYTRKMVRWGLNFDEENRKSWYKRANDKITLAWGLRNSNAFLLVAAHEYGHAYHHKALGGLFGKWSTPGCGSHDLDKVTTYECALSEGFAHYAGVVGANGHRTDCFEYFGEPDRPGWSKCRKGSRKLGDKPKIEGHVTALFMDLIDDDDETHDWVEYPAKYVATVFRTCEVQKKHLKIFKKWHKRSKVSDIVWCLQNQIHPSQHKKDSVFGDHDHPLAFKERATEPDDHHPIKIMATWEHNLK